MTPVTSAFGRRLGGPFDPLLPSEQPTPLPVKVPEQVDDAAAARADAAPANATAAGDDATAAGDDAAATGDDATANNGNLYGSATVATVDPAPADVRVGSAKQWLDDTCLDSLKRELRKLRGAAIEDIDFVVVGDWQLRKAGFVGEASSNEHFDRCQQQFLAAARQPAQHHAPV